MTGEGNVDVFCKYKPSRFTVPQMEDGDNIIRPPSIRHSHTAGIKNFEILLRVVNSISFFALSSISKLTKAC